jgi:alpha-tubulin suppressor-like RCC1 family protein
VENIIVKAVRLLAFLLYLLSHEGKDSAGLGQTTLQQLGETDGRLGETKNLVVMITCPLEEGRVWGAGIIFGLAGDELYIVTTNHLAQQCQQRSGSFQVEFRRPSGARAQASLMKDRDTSVDLAVLKVTGLKTIGVQGDMLPFDRIADSSSLTDTGIVNMVGYPDQKPWSVNEFPGFVQSTNQDVIRFQTSFLAIGDSGGALLNQNSDIVGMIRTDEPPQSEAITLSAIIRRLNEWKYPVNLGKPFELRGFRSIAVGATHACAVAQNDVAYCWGEGGLGGLGAGNMQADRSEKVQRVVGMTKFKSLSAGDKVTCGIATDNIAYCWGSVGGDGWQTKFAPRYVSPNLRFSSVSVGDGSFTCGVATTGDAYCWGDNRFGQLGNGKGGNSRTNENDSLTPVLVSGGIRFESISAGDLQVCGISIVGDAYCWGLPYGKVPVKVPGGLLYSSLSTGSQNVCGIAKTGAAYCWKDDGKDPSLVPGNIKFKSLSNGDGFSCGVRADGVGYCWGKNDNGQLGNGNWEDSDQPVPIAGGLYFSALGAGKGHLDGLACGLTVKGTVYCWGASILQANGSMRPSKIPIRVPGQP